MKLKFEVLGSGSFEGQTKTGQKFQRMRMMGFVFDCEGTKIPSTCDMGFQAHVDSEPKAGEVVVVDISSFDMRNAMASLVFTSLSHVSSSARELKH